MSEPEAGHSRRVILPHHTRYSPLPFPLTIVHSLHIPAGRMPHRKNV